MKKLNVKVLGVKNTQEIVSLKTRSYYIRPFHFTWICLQLVLKNVLTY